jgi:hypothetical protein
LVLALAAGCSRAPAPPPARPKIEVSKTNAVGAIPAGLANDYASVFEDLSPQQGKDPFFPVSRRRDPVPNATSQSALHADPVLVLKAIVRASKHGQAVINNQIFEVGEEESVRVPGGHVLVRCIEIGNDYVLIQVEGEAEPKRLSVEQKKI